MNTSGLALALAKLRREETERLKAAGIVALPYAPAQLNPPALIFGYAAGPYLEPGDTFGTWQVNAGFVYVFRAAEGAGLVKAVDDALANVLAVLVEAWAVASVMPPRKTQNWAGLVACQILAHTIIVEETTE